MTELVEHYEDMVRLIERTVTNKIKVPGPLKALSLLKQHQNVLTEAEVREIAGAMARGHLIYSRIIEQPVGGIR